MIKGISVMNFMSIKSLEVVPLNSFHVLVGPNASGKSTFLDVIQFVRDCLVLGPLQAVENRVPDFDDLTFMRRGGDISIRIWLEGGALLEQQQGNLLFYAITVGKDEHLGLGLKQELLSKSPSNSWIFYNNIVKFVGDRSRSEILVANELDKGVRLRENNINDSFYFGLDKLALSLVPPDETRYPTANAVKRFLMQGIRHLQLNSVAMRNPCPAMSPGELALDGTNIAKVVGRMEEEAKAEWINHLRYALPDLVGIGWGKREADNAEYLVLKYQNGLTCPSWLASDGTLRMLALTLPAFLPGKQGIYLVEEPENGVHPHALEIIIRALSSVPVAQVFLATHSPLVVQQVGRDDLLCFSTSEEDGCRIRLGADHPNLHDWQGTPDLATIFASGVLE